MSKENRKRQRPLEEDDEANCSFAAGLNSEWSFNLEEDNGPNIGNGNANDLKEVKLKMATLEAKIQMFESKLENQELKAQNRALKEKNALNELKEENKAIRQKFKEANEQAQMEKNAWNEVKEENKAIREKLKETVESAKMFESTIQGIQQKMEDLRKEMSGQNDEKLMKQKQEMEEKNELLMKRLKDVEEKAQTANKEFELTIKGIQQRMEESAKEMAIQSQEQQKKMQNLEDLVKEMGTQNKEHQKKIQNLEGKNQTLVNMMNAVEIKAQMDKNGLMQKMNNSEATLAKKLANLEEKQKNNLSMMKKENKTVLEKLKKAEEKAQIVNNEQLTQQMDQFGEDIAKKLASLKEQQNKSLDKKMKESIQKLTTSVEVQRVNKMAELKVKMQEKNKAFDMMKDAQQKANNNLEASIQMNQQTLREFAEEIVTLREEQNKQPVFNLDQLEPDILWNHLIKGKRVGNPTNRWNENKTKVEITEDGLKAKNEDKWEYVFAEKAFAISSEHSRFPGKIIYYFEVSLISESGLFYVGLSDGNIPDDSCIDKTPNCYSISDGYDHCWLSGQKHHFEWPNGAMWNGPGDVLGCGLLLSSDDKLSIFFTGNGILIGRQIPICPSVDCLYPTVSMWQVSLQANFGEDSNKPFKYDIENCAGLTFE